ncbi:MAG: hypothetical protein OXC62_08070 [Aestuariivita sp.]|nr:hypothetical protein [Aestuariivita sp.]
MFDQAACLSNDECGVHESYSEFENSRHLPLPRITSQQAYESGLRKTESFMFDWELRCDDHNSTDLSDVIFAGRPTNLNRDAIA